MVLTIDVVNVRIPAVIIVPIPVISVAAVLVETAMVDSLTFLSTKLVLQPAERSRPTGGELLGIVELFVNIVVWTHFFLLLY